MKAGLAGIASGLMALLGAGCMAFAQQQAVPDAPTPQPTPALSGVAGPITPGQGSDAGITDPTAPSAPSGPGASSSNTPEPGASLPSSTSPQAAGPDQFQTQAPDLTSSPTVRLTVNFVELPVTVKDSKGKQVPGLTWRDFRVFENGQRQTLRLFSSDAAPLAIAFVVDQSLTADVMEKVNRSLDSIQGALTPYDEIAVFSYSHGTQERTGFTGAQSARVNAVLALTRSTGTEELVPVNSGPLAGCNIRENGACVDPNIQPGRSTGSPIGAITIPKEIHTLNDAILAAAKELSSRPKDFRRVIYVVSDGKEAGSKATYKDVVRYLQTNNIAVYGTLVGDSARWGEGYLSRLHIPFTMYENRLAGYAIATGGTLDSERGVNGIENSYAELAKDARTQYTLGYYSHEPFIDGKYRKIEVRVERSGLEIVTKQGYYPSALDAAAPPAR